MFEAATQALEEAVNVVRLAQAGDEVRPLDSGKEGRCSLLPTRTQQVGQGEAQ